MFVFHGRTSPTCPEEDEECVNYDISDLCSDDSTDDELEPRKKLPTWADGLYNCTGECWASYALQLLVTLTKK